MTHSESKTPIARRVSQRFALTLAVAMASVGVAAEDASSPAASDPTRRIAFTFDDAPREDGAFFTGKARTAALIDALGRADVRGAMFFVTTRNLARHDPDAARLAAYTAVGHVLGNHSDTHQWARRTPVESYLADIDRAQQKLQGLEGFRPYFRFPFLDEGHDVATRDALRAGLSERSLQHGYVTIDNYDWYMDALAAESQSANQAIDRELLGRVYVEVMMSAIRFYDQLARDTLGRSPAHVLLLHENDLAALYVDDLAETLRAEGWQIIPAEEAYRDAIADTLPDTLFNGQGRVAAMADVIKLKPRREMVHESEDEDWLRRLFVARGLLPNPARTRD